MGNAPPNLAVVVIGRNEGQRLRACLGSIDSTKTPVVYVDSGSTDESVALAREYGADVVELDNSRPYTAARGRNAGVARLRETGRDVDYIQFVDGDCALAPGWLVKACMYLSSQQEMAVVTGLLKEKNPDASIYNRLCQLEWRAPTGDIKTCGGIFMIRREAFEQMGGFREDLIAGEEPELCVRLRQAGWRLHRLDRHMATHDAEMMRFSQWWTRSVRSGHAAAEGMALHGKPPERFRVREVHSSLFWGGLVPAVFLGCGLWGFLWLPALLGALACAGATFFQGWRIARGRRARGEGRGDASIYALFCMLGKFPETLGILQYSLNRLRKRRSELIEYK